MKELMKNLYDISIDEDKAEQLNKRINNVINMGKKVGIAALGGMALLDIISALGDSVISQNNDIIASEIAKLENSDNQKTVNAITIYKEFIPLMNRFAEACEKAENEGDELREETTYEIISSLNDLFLELYNQTLQNIDISQDDSEEYERFANWVEFWALMFYDGDQFRAAYPINLLEEMPECWDAVVDLMDELLEGKWNEAFSDIVFNFADKVISNSVEMLELMSSSDWDDDFLDAAGEIVESNNQAVKSLKDELDRATDYLMDLLPDSEA